MFYHITVPLTGLITLYSSTLTYMRTHSGSSAMGGAGQQTQQQQFPHAALPSFQPLGFDNFGQQVPPCRCHRVPRVTLFRCVFALRLLDSGCSARPFSTGVLTWSALASCLPVALGERHDSARGRKQRVDDASEEDHRGVGATARGRAKRQTGPPLRAPAGGVLEHWRVILTWSAFCLGAFAEDGGRSTEHAR